MALIDLSLVTKALVEILEKRVNVLLKEHIEGNSTDWPQETKMKVVPVSPNLLDKQDGNVLGLYLYHISEDAHFKNLPATSNEEPPVRYTPMGLNLYYQLTARSAQEDKTGTYREQIMLGLAMKALHDCPIVNDFTRIVGKNQPQIDVLKDVGLADSGNRLRISLHPLAPNEAVSYWTAGTSPLRLATYYQVSVVLLEPEKIQSRVSRVSTYNIQTFIGVGPRLDSSHNVISITIPGQQPRKVELRPAQVSVGDTLTFTGSDLSGDSISLYLNQASWKEPVKVDGSPAAWNVTRLDENRVTAKIQKQAGGKEILPGIYSASVAVTKSQTSSMGGSQAFEVISNETPFAVTPLIESIGTPTASQEVTVKSYLFQSIEDKNISEKAVRFYLGSRALSAGTANNLQEYEYALVNPTPPPPPPPNTKDLKLKLPAVMAPGDSLPFRLLINGVESPPKWITVPKP